MNIHRAGYGLRTFPEIVQIHAVGRGNLLALGWVLCVLRCGCYGQCPCQYPKTYRAKHLVTLQFSIRRSVSDFP